MHFEPSRNDFAPTTGVHMLQSLMQLLYLVLMYKSILKPNSTYNTYRSLEACV